MIPVTLPSSKGARGDLLVTGPPIHHQPVLLSETLEWLAVHAGGRCIDCTVGDGGHAEAVLEASAPIGRLLGLDADPQALEVARRRLAGFGEAFIPVLANFADLAKVAETYDFRRVDGILFDLGLSSLQLASQGRGFSFQQDDPLDMRLNPQQEFTAAEVVNASAEEELAAVLFQLGEEPQARRIARAIVRARPLQTTQQLAQLVERIVQRKGRRHPATRVFQALRMAVNDDLGNLERALPAAVELLEPRGRLAVISYHSLEDRLVKQFLQREARDCLCPPETLVCQCGHRAQLSILTRKVVTPSKEEVARNPRSRSAKLRVAERKIS